MCFSNGMHQLGSYGCRAVGLICHSDVEEIKKWHHCRWYEISFLIISQFFVAPLVCKLWPQHKSKTTNQFKARQYFSCYATNLRPDTTLLCANDSHFKVLDTTPHRRTQRVKSICKHLHTMYLSKFKLQWKKFCDPFAKHKKTVKTGLVSILLLQANKWALSSGKTLIPGQKICQACWRLLQDLSADYATTSTPSSTESEAESPTHWTMDAVLINIIWTVLGITFKTTW